MLPSRRDLLDLAIRAAALPAAGEFFSTWLKAADDHKHASGSTGPPEPPLLRDYQPSGRVMDALHSKDNADNSSSPVRNHPKHHAIQGNGEGRRLMPRWK